MEVFIPVLPVICLNNQLSTFMFYLQVTVLMALKVLSGIEGLTGVFMAAILCASIRFAEMIIINNKS